ncbi:hypothetical protein K438DRAFT_1985923 [Mycena galopus ATCC 62051]|nr:hypothetical protein K438DRAFT_1985923 [Mycena galopus ATCC 62051]
MNLFALQTHATPFTVHSTPEQSFIVYHGVLRVLQRSLSDAHAVARLLVRVRVSDPDMDAEKAARVRPLWGSECAASLASAQCQMPNISYSHPLPSFFLRETANLLSLRFALILGHSSVRNHANPSRAPANVKVEPTLAPRVSARGLERRTEVRVLLDIHDSEFDALSLERPMQYK